MEMLLYQSTQFRDVKKILDRAHGFAGLLTAGGIEASRLDVPFVCDQKVLSRYDDACGDVRRILAMQLGLELPKGFSIPLEAEDLAVFFSQRLALDPAEHDLRPRMALLRAERAQEVELHRCFQIAAAADGGLKLPGRMHIGFRLSQLPRVAPQGKPLALPW